MENGYLERTRPQERLDSFQQTLLILLHHCHETISCLFHLEFIYWIQYYNDANFVVLDQILISLRVMFVQIGSIGCMQIPKSLI